MAEPTDEQLKDYVTEMPQIYKSALIAIPETDPRRRARDPIKADEIVARITDADQDIRRIDVVTALTQLADRGFFSKELLSPFYHTTPTDLGERAIKSSTGTIARPAMIPALPEPSWAS